jgi:SAM-dependent methyltransferase/predicted acetyltransferase
MRYRLAEERDVPLLAQMNKQLIRDEGHRNDMTLGELARRMKEWLEGGYQAVLIEPDSLAIGYALFRFEQDHVYLRQFFVSSESRRQGVGRAALAWLWINLWRDAPRVRLDVLLGNEEGLAFWRAVGFQGYCLTMEAEAPDWQGMRDAEAPGVQHCILDEMPDSEAFYDRDDVLENYLQHRRRPDNPNDAVERPAFLQLAGDLKDLDIIDLGCGDALFGREALERGARSYVGVEVSESMATLAQRNLAGLAGRIEHASIEDWRAEPATADLVTSRLALNYIEDLAGIFRHMHESLRPGGRVVLSVEHPVITSSFESLASGRRSNWLVDDYFRTGPRPHRWLGHEVLKYHRTLDDYLDLVQNSGMLLERVRESRPSRENFQSEEEYQRRLRIPLFLMIAARKPVAPQ